jgi:prepilin peptidase CpaA
MLIRMHLLPLAGFAGLMLTAAVEDLRRLLIPNRLTVALCALWPFHLATTTLAIAPLAALGCSLAVFLSGALLFARGVLGGGDVKLLSAATLWAGPQATVPLLVGTALIGGLLALVLLIPAAGRLIGGLRRSETAPAEPNDAALRAPMPYGIAIAAAALIVTIPPNFG